MSTILDALRKVEGEHRARTSDARARLLFSSALPPLRRPRRQRIPWLIGAGLALGGFAAGVGIILWKAPFEVEKTQVASAPAQPDHSFHQSSTSVETVLPAPVPTTSDEKTDSFSSPSLVPSSGLTEQLPAPEVTYEVYTDGASPVVQRSPFASPTPAAREVAAAPQPTPPPSASNQENQSFLVGADVQGDAAGGDQNSSPPVQETRGDTVNFPTTEGDTLYQSTDGGQTWSSTPALDATPANTSLSFLQWSSEPSKRIAFIKVNGGPLTLAQEGDTVGGFTVVEIRRDEVELRSGNATFTLRTK